MYPTLEILVAVSDIESFEYLVAPLINALFENFEINIVSCSSLIDNSVKNFYHKKV